MAWQLDQVGAVKAITNIMKRMRRCADVNIHTKLRVRKIPGSYLGILVQEA
jgi:hypothetical protein